MRPLIGLLALCACAQVKDAPFGQQVRVFYSTAQGLPSNDVRDVYVTEDRVWADTAGGAARFDGREWVKVSSAPARPPRESWTVRLDQPVAEHTSVARAKDGIVWLGSKRGAMRFDGTSWEYRQGLRWLPHDEVRSVAVQGQRAFFATPEGIGVIEAQPVTLASKAAHFEKDIAARHRRTEYGYVLGVSCATPGDASNCTQGDSDNDGLWTSMYGAGECYACALGDGSACSRAKFAFEALRFLRVVTEGVAPPGFLARTVLPVSGPDPNLTYTPERDEEFRRTRDKLWKVMRPRWPKSKDGKWYWKSDTSSDELDGHFFFYALYYDLVAKTEAEKALVREHVGAVAGHLVANGFKLIDHDGRPTRWGIFDPENLNGNPAWLEERGLNSLSMLSYLATAAHVTGDAKFAEAAKMLRDRHAYHLNVAIPKTNAGPGSGNQSDDEMAFMCLYNLLKYEKDAALRAIYAYAFRRRWEIEQPELNPLFNVMAAARLKGLVFADSHGSESLELTGPWLEESVDTLRRYPLDRFNWGMSNSHRQDLAPLPPYAGTRGAQRGHKKDGRVLPVDERFVEHWNHDPWQLDYRGDGRRLADGASFLLPYYMARYYGYVVQ